MDEGNLNSESSESEEIDELWRYGGEAPDRHRYPDLAEFPELNRRSGIRLLPNQGHQRSRAAVPSRPASDSTPSLSEASNEAGESDRSARSDFLARDFPEFFDRASEDTLSVSTRSNIGHEGQLVREAAAFGGGSSDSSSSTSEGGERDSPPRNNARNRADRERYARRNRANLAPPPSNLNRVAFAYLPDVDYPASIHIRIGLLSRVCIHCNALTFVAEPPGMCCDGGKVEIQLFAPPPEPVRSLYEGQHPDSAHFLSNIRRYNSLFQMTSFGVRGGGVVNHGRFMPTFKIQGQVYHRIGSLLPVEERARYLQIYFVGDHEAQIEARMSPQVRRNIVSLFQELLNEHNIHVRFFRTALDRMPADEYSIVIRADRAPAEEHRGRFSEPARNEVAIVIVQNPGEYSRDIIIHRRNMRVERISETHRFYDSYQYPLLLWQGMETYHFNLRQVDPATGLATSRKVSAMSYYAYQLMVRDDGNDFLLNCGQLLNQFVVDMYAKIETERLAYLRTHQENLRVDEYVNLADAMRNDANPEHLGRRFILPSSFIGGPRHMHEYAQDAIAFVRLYGRPDLFITFTCNPDWPEIRRHLKSHQNAYERYDIVARVFRQKVLKLMSLLTVRHVFGPDKGHVYAIEWQKRGLPHVHILLWLIDRIQPEEVDLIISAELPDPDTDPTLSDIVRRNMIHGPCEAANGGDDRCRDEQGRCLRRYPRPFSIATHHGEDGYPLYRRRSPADGGREFQVIWNATLNRARVQIPITIDNRWVVPYCPFLSKAFNAHINIEYCHSVKSIKYICKYVNKDNDLAMIQLNNVNPNRNDEIEMYQLGRYLSSNEAFWRIFGFRIHDRKPVVEHLTVHLENGQRVYFRNADQVQAMLRANDPPNSTLTAFFHLCRTDPFARTLRYYEVPTYYTWVRASKTWRRRVQGISVDGWPGDVRSAAIGRVYTVHPSQDECFFLRILLMKVRGPTWFDSLKEFEGETYQTYRLACIARGLLDDDLHLIRTLQDAVASRDPFRIRELFAVIITQCEPSDPAMGVI